MQATTAKMDKWDSIKLEPLCSKGNNREEGKLLNMRKYSQPCIKQGLFVKPL